MELLSLKNVSVGYDGKAVAENITFSLNRGDYLCIIGENGAGKSTLMKTLLSLRAPVSGEIRFADGFLRTQIGYLPQQTDVQKDFPATVFEVALSGCLNECGLRPFYSKAQKEKAKKWLERLGILQYRKRSYRALSGGQQQRVLLARALCAANGLILLDEPAAGLDPIVTKNMYELIKSLNEENGVTVIMVSHDLAAAMKYASHILQISRSGAFFGTVSEYRSSAQGRAFLGKEGEDDA